MKKGLSIQSGILGLAAAFTALPAAMAQAPAADEANELQEIVVLARKFEENLQNVPLTISVIDQSALREKVVRDLSDVAKLTPGFTYEQGSTTGDSKPNIRGLTAVRGRPNVAILIDGVDQTTEAIGVPGGGLLPSLRFSDICQVEVVKGPQSVLYGRSAFAGAVSYTTCRPDTDKASGEVLVGGGSFGTQEVNIIGNQPLSDTAAMRFTINYVNFDGDWKNPVTGGDLNARESTSGSISFKWQPSDTFSVFTKFQKSKDDASQPARISVAPVDVFTGQVITANNGVFAPYLSFNLRTGATSPAFGNGYFTQQGDMTTTLSARQRAIQLSPDPRTGRDFEGTSVDTTRALLELTWDLPSGSFKSLTALLKSDQFISEDFDYTNERLTSAGYAVYAPISQFLGYPPNTPVPTFALSALREANADVEQLTQEFIFRSDFDGPLQIQADALYWREETASLGASQFWCKEGTSQFFCTIIGSFQGGNPAKPALMAPLPLEQVPFRDLTIRDQQSYSLGLGVSYALTDAVNVSLGGRYFDETYDYQGYPYDQFPVRTFSAPVPNIPNPTARVKSSKFVPQFTFDWKYAEDALLFASAAKGFKPGGIDTTQNTGFVDQVSRQFKPENLLAIELGTKNEFLDRRLRVNASVFLNDYTDQQVPVNVQIGALPQTGTINIGESETRGLELAVDWRAAERLDLGLRYTFTDAEFTDYEVPGSLLTWTPSATPGGNGTITDANGNIIRAGGISDRSESQLSGFVPTNNSLSAGNPNNLAVIFGATGKKVPRVPKHQVVVSARYGFTMGEWDSFVGIDAQHQSLRYLNQYNNFWLPKFTIANLQIGFEKDAWSWQGYVNNLFDDDTIRQGGTSSLFGFFDLRNNQLPRQGVLIAPEKRVMGLRVAYKFGD
ncbi:MAG: TonB-dependent receptor [Steroidobacteraceae bacterium]